MLIIGLTGSIGMGKSTAADRFRIVGIPVCDVDALVHDLYSDLAGPAVSLVEAAFPGTTGAQGVDRQKLSAALLLDPSGFTRLEAIVHPLVRAAEKEFLQVQWQAGAVMAVLEIPLLFETGAYKTVDVVIVVSAPASVQRARVLAREGMSEVKFEQLLRRQMPDFKKRQLADHVIDTGASMEASGAQLDAIIAELTQKPGTSFKTYWE